MNYNGLHTLCLAIAIVSLHVSTSRAQGKVSDSWLQRAGGGGSDFGEAMTVDTNGNTYITGGFQEVAYFEERELTARGVDDIFIAKYDYAGNVVWVKGAGSDVGSQANEYGTDIVIAGDYLYVTGIFAKTATFDNYLVQSNGSNDIFLAKYTLQGHLVWVRSAGGPQQDMPHALAVDSEGNVYLTGMVQDAAQFGTYTTAPNAPAFFLAKYNADGNVRWVRHSNGNALVEGKDVVVSGGHCYVIGNTDGITRFDGTTLKVWQPSAFLNKYTLDGELAWTKQLAGGPHISAESMQVGSRGLYVGGNFNDALQIGATPYKSKGDSDGFLMRVDEEGTVQWIKTMGGPKADLIRTVAVSPDMQVVVGGEFSEYITMDSTRMPGVHMRDLFIASYSEQGFVNGTDCLAAKGQVRLKDMVVAANQITLVGSFSGNVHHGANSLDPEGISDVLMAGLMLPPVDDHAASSSNRVAFYLDPAFSVLTVESTDPLDVLQILDMAGNILVKKTLEGEYKAQVSLKALSSGSYIVWASSKKKIKSAKFDLRR